MHCYACKGFYRDRDSLARRAAVTGCSRRRRSAAKLSRAAIPHRNRACLRPELRLMVGGSGCLGDIVPSGFVSF
jgi:hypothetical protein